MNTNNTAVSTFSFNAAAIRVVTIDGQPWFVATDINEAMGWTYQNLKAHLSRNIGADERGQTKVATPGGAQAVTIISESGLYKLVMRSDKPEARQFQDWVTKEVLPAIRKDGGYIMGEEKVRTGEMSEDELILKALTILNAKVSRITAAALLSVSNRGTGR